MRTYRSSGVGAVHNARLAASGPNTATKANDRSNENVLMPNLDPGTFWAALLLRWVRLGYLAREQHQGLA